MSQRLLNIFSIFLIFIMGLSLAGCKDKTPRIFLSTRPIMRETFVPMNEFVKNDTINFILIAPKGFRSDTVRMQLIKKSNLSHDWGYKLMLGKDYNVENEYYLTGSFTVYSAGRYEVQFYDINGPKKKTHFPAKQYFPYPDPLAYAEFGVFDK